MIMTGTVKIWIRKLQAVTQTNARN